LIQKGDPEDAPFVPPSTKEEGPWLIVVIIVVGAILLILILACLCYGCKRCQAKRKQGAAPAGLLKSYDNIQAEENEQTEEGETYFRN